MKKSIRNSLVGLGLLGVVLAAPLVVGADFNICVTIPEAGKQRAVDSFVDVYKYQETIPSSTGAYIPNPQSQGQFAIFQVKEFVRRTVKRSETRKALDAAKEAIEEIDIQ